MESFFGTLSVAIGLLLFVGLFAVRDIAIVGVRDVNTRWLVEPGYGYFSGALYQGYHRGRTQLLWIGSQLAYSGMHALAWFFVAAIYGKVTGENDWLAGLERGHAFAAIFLLVSYRLIQSIAEHFAKRWVMYYAEYNPCQQAVA